LPATHQISSKMTLMHHIGAYLGFFIDLKIQNSAA
jgi:hypothetical protein